MKTLKFASHLVPLILSGEKKSTWRIFDDKELQVGDDLLFVEKATGQEFAKASIIGIREKRIGDITEEDEIQDAQARFEDATDRLETFQMYYGQQVTEDTVVKMIKYTIVNEA